MSEDKSKKKGSETPDVQSLTPENSAAWVEKYVSWASRILDKQAAEENDK
jgi:hypothetical protein